MFIFRQLITICPTHHVSRVMTHSGAVEKAGGGKNVLKRFYTKANASRTLDAICQKCSRTHACTYVLSAPGAHLHIRLLESDLSVAGPVDFPLDNTDNTSLGVLGITSTTGHCCLLWSGTATATGRTLNALVTSKYRSQVTPSL